MFVADSPHTGTIQNSLHYSDQPMTADAWNGYHSMAVHPDDVHYFTFITEWGR